MVVLHNGVELHHSVLLAQWSAEVGSTLTRIQYKLQVVLSKSRGGKSVYVRTNAVWYSEKLHPTIQTILRIAHAQRMRNAVR